ncbi:MAG: desulfoferrodoxin [Cyanobacteria bacterium SIG30]|nr:desulfoferrodoxin [Cyanobacteria bacterium SIG30]
MTHKLELYRCDICGNLIEVILPGAGALVCCEEEMELLTPKTQDSGAEKHVPVIEHKDGEVTIRIGSEPHPMEKEHYIQFVEAIANDNKYLKRKYFEPNEEPVLKFKCECASGVSSREFCNVHGLWASSEVSHDGK